MDAAAWASDMFLLIWFCWLDWISFHTHFSYHTCEIPIVCFPGGSESKQRPNWWHRDEPGQQEGSEGDWEVCTSGGLEQQRGRSIHRPPSHQHPFTSRHPDCDLHQPSASQAPRTSWWSQDGWTRRWGGLDQRGVSTNPGDLRRDGRPPADHGGAEDHPERQSSAQHPRKRCWEARESLYVPPRKQQQQQWWWWGWKTRWTAGWWKPQQGVQHLQTPLWRFQKGGQLQR